MANIAMGFRAPPHIHGAISELAESSNRSIGNVLTLMVAEQLKRVEAEGFDAIFYKEEGKYEQERAG